MRFSYSGSPNTAVSWSSNSRGGSNRAPNQATFQAYASVSSNPAQNQAPSRPSRPSYPSRPTTNVRKKVNELWFIAWKIYCLLEIKIDRLWLTGPFSMFGPKQGWFKRRSAFATRRCWRLTNSAGDLSRAKISWLTSSAAPRSDIN